MLMVVTVWQFDLTYEMKLVFVGLMSAVCLREIFKCQRSSMVIQFERKQKRWRLSIDEEPFVIVSKLAPIYLGAHLVWLKVDCRCLTSRTLLIFDDALPEEKLLQFRRCILEYGA